MNYVEYAFPELDEVRGFSPSEQNVLIDEIGQLHAYQAQLVQILIEQKVHQAAAAHHPDITKVIVHPTYANDTGGYGFVNAMVWVDNFLDPSLSAPGRHEKEKRFQRALDHSLAGIAHMTRDIMEMDVAELAQRYNISHHATSQASEPDSSHPLSGAQDFGRASYRDTKNMLPPQVHHNHVNEQAPEDASKSAEGQTMKKTKPKWDF